MKRWIAVAFALTCLAQIAVPGWMLVRHRRALERGDAFRFRLAPVDPVDAFRGRYVALSFADASAPAPDGGMLRGQTVYAVIEEGDDGFARFARALDAPPEDAPYVRTRAWGVWNDRVQLEVPFDRYYLKETLAPRAERIYRERSRGESWDAHAVVRVLDGYAVIEELYLEGVPVRRYLEEHAGPG